MYDTTKPAVDVLESAYASGKSLKEASELVIIAAKEGMNATKDMMALRGRSSRLGERSIGYIDPGSASMYIIISTFFKSVVWLLKVPTTPWIACWKCGIGFKNGI